MFFTRRFLPLFITQFLGAMNDNLLKNAMLMLVTYRLAQQGNNAQAFTALAGGIFILPFFLFSATAGILADAIDRRRIARSVKLAEIGIMAIAVLGFFAESRGVLLVALFCMGIHSAFFGPIKYSLLPQHLRKDELLAGNAYIEGGSFLAILIGTIFGGLIVLSEGGTARISLALIVVAAAGYGASRLIPAAPPPKPGLKVSLHLWRETLGILRQAKANQRVFRSILGISWFWLLGAAFLSQLPVFTRDVLSGEAPVVTLLLTVFSLGIGIGSVICSRLMKGEVRSSYVPPAALGMSLFMIDLYFASRGWQPVAMRGVAEFLSVGASWRIMFDLGMIAVCGGIYTVPLYTLMQHESAEEVRARIIAANNVMNALFMVASAILLLIFVKIQASIPQTFLLLGLCNLGVAVYIATLLPETIIRALCRGALRLLYRVEITGLEHYRAAGDRVLLIANHTSLLDAVLIAAFLPEKVVFAVNTHIARKWWMRPLLSLVDTFALDPANPMATKALIARLKENGRVMIFPEGRITVTGAVMKVYEGPGMIADKAEAMILPIRIDGAQYTPFSYLRGKLRLRLFPKIRLTVLPPQRFHLADDIRGRHRRRLASARLYEVMTRMMFETSPYRRTLFHALLDAQAIHGTGQIVAEDIERKALSYRAFIARSLTLGRRLADRSNHPIGLLLPTSLPMALSLFGLIGFGRVPALLNFSAGSAALVSACLTAGLKRIVSSRRFVVQAKLASVIEALEDAGVTVTYLEDIRLAMTFRDRLFGLAALLSPSLLHRRVAPRPDADAAAVILFTSGSEGTPKGVVLSHANLLANIYQVAAIADFSERDIVFNCLPMFHAFGLTGGTLLPLLGGMRCFLYPSPLHYRIVPELIYDSNATILFGTDTFLAGYAKAANPYDLYSIRYIFAGAEKLKDETRNVFMEQFGQRIYEGYGATETAPILSVNTPMLYRSGTVGHLVPGIEHRLDAMPGISEGGRLMVRGPNVMLGYLKAENPGQLQPLEDGWYDTGDIVTIDEDDYLRIAGRAKRFAKIAGEMVPLPSVEAAVEALWPNEDHAALSLPDARKGEQVALLTTRKDASRTDLQKHFREKGLPDLWLPKSLITVDAIPLLGTGKRDYNTARDRALACLPSVTEPAENETGTGDEA